MKIRFLILLIILSTNILAQKEVLNLAGFGEIPFTKSGNSYSASLGKLGKFDFVGSINPLSLSTSIGLDDMKAFPGAKILGAIGVEDIELTVAKKGVEIAANIGNKFKEKIKKKLRNKKILAPVIGTILKTIDIRDSQIALLFDTNGKLGGKIALNVYVFGQKLPIPVLKADMNLEKIIGTVVDAITKEGLNKIGKVAQVVGKAAVKSAKAVANAGEVAFKYAGNYVSHVYHTQGHCDGTCVPRLAKGKAKPLRLKSQKAIGEFYTDVIAVLKNIQGETPQQTELLRKSYIEKDWKILMAKVDNNWNKVRKDRTYVSYYNTPSSAGNGGNIYRRKVDEEKNKFYDYSNLMWDRLLHETGLEFKIKDICMIRSKANNLYWDIKGVHFGAEKKNTKILLSKKDNLHNGICQGADRLIKVYKQPTNGQLFFQPQHSEGYLGFYKSNELKLTQIVNAKGFKKRPVSGEPGAFYIVNQTNSNYLTAESNRVVQKPFNEKDNQKWFFEWITDPAVMAPPDYSNFRYAIKNLDSRKYINVLKERVKQGYNLKPFKVSKSAARKSVRVTVYGRQNGNESPDQYFKFFSKKSANEHYFQLKPMLGQNVLNVMDGNIKDGTPLELWKIANEIKEQFKFIYTGSPMTYFIQERNSGKFLQVPNRNNGAPVQIHRFTGNKNQKWTLEAYAKWIMPKENTSFYIKSVYCNNEYWDPDGTDCKKGDKIKNWAYQDKADRKFLIASTRDQFWLNILSAKSGKAVEVPGNSSNNGTQIQFGDRIRGASNQKFGFEFTSPTTFRIYTSAKKYLDVEGDSENGDSWKDDGKKIQTNKDFYVRDRHFQLIYADGPKKGKPYRMKTP